MGYIHVYIYISINTPPWNSVDDVDPTSKPRSLVQDIRIAHVLIYSFSEVVGQTKGLADPRLGAGHVWGQPTKKAGLNNQEYNGGS